jgi:hypothetical protein
MISWNEMEQLGRDAAKVAHQGAGVSIGWIDFAAFAVPILIALYFKKHVSLLGI